MKKLVLVLVMVLAFNLSNAQELFKNKVDEFTGSEIKISKWYEISRTKRFKLNVCTMRIKSEDGKIYHYLKGYVNLKDFGCGGANGNYMMILFKDGKSIKFDNDISDVDCGDYASSTYSLNESNMSDINSKEIKTIRFNQGEGYMDLTSSGEYTLKQLFSILN